MSVDQPVLGRPAPTTPPAGEPPEEPTKWLGLLFIGALVLFLGFTYSWFAVVMVLALAVCIFLHELGHYLTAKAAGMKVTEFFLGFGPRLWSFRRGETEYGVKAIPAGAYVRIIGMNNIEEVDPEDEPRTYRAKPFWRRLSVAVAGSTMHFILAFVLIFTVFAGFAAPDFASRDWTIRTVSGPARDAGIQSGDRIITVDGRPRENFSEVSNYLRANPGKTVTVVVERDGRRLTLTPELGDHNPSTGEDVGYLGVAPKVPEVRQGPGSALVDSVRATRSAVWQSLVGIKRLFSPEGLTGYYENVRDAGKTADGAADPNRVTSVKGLVDIGSQAAKDGVVDLLYLLFFFNVFIGVFNLTPLLPFDGGHVVIAVYEKIRSMISGRTYRADVAKLMPLTYAVVLLLAVLFITSLYVDIVNPPSLR